jgi:chromosome partitioning protein
LTRHAAIAAVIHSQKKTLWLQPASALRHCDIARAAQNDGLTVSVIDLDPQRSAEQWSEYREARAADAAKANPRSAAKKGAPKCAPKIRGDEPPVVYGTPQNLDHMLKAARQTATDLVLIDTPPALDKQMIYAASCADMVIVPTRSGILDQFALRETLDYLARIHAIAKAVVILNAPGSDKDARSEVEKIAAQEFRVPVLSASLADLADLAKSLREGKGITETAKTGKSLKALKDVYRQLSEHDRRLQDTKRGVAV